MRTAFVAELGQIMARDPRAMLLVGDLGYHVIEPLVAAYPDRVVNVGVSEQNMAGMAAGLAQSGFVPCIYSIATFVTMRAFEFIRNGAVVHDLPVRVIGIGGGVEYGTLGISHYALEDFALMRALGGMTVVAPADGAQAASALRATWDLPGPVYYRIGKNDRDVLPELEGRFGLGRIESIGPMDGSVAVLATGAAAVHAYAAVEQSRAEGKSCRFAVVAGLAPTPRAAILDVIRHCDHVLTVEAHYATGGLGTIVAEVMAESGSKARLKRIAIHSVPNIYSGSQQAIERSLQIDQEAVHDAIGEACRRAE